MITKSAIGPILIGSIDLEEMGRLLGVPLKVRPWWGSRRGLKWSRVLQRQTLPWYREWMCAASFMSYYSHTPPRVVGRLIVVYEGRCGKKWGNRTHKHHQCFKVISVQPGAILLEVRAGTDRYIQSGLYLVGVDGARPYVARVAQCSSVKEAFEVLKPEEVLRAERLGLEVKRQGDWFFIPRDKPPKQGDREFEPPRFTGHALFGSPPPSPTRHYAEEIMQSAYCGHVVRGRIASPDHGTLVLKGWHTAVRNRAIRDLGSSAGAD